MKSLLNDLLAGLLFLAVYSLTRDLAAAIVVSAGTSVAVIGWRLLRREPVSPVQWLTLGLVVTMGGASLITRDPRFVMVKPTIVQSALAVTMLQPGWLNRYISAERRAQIPERAILIAGYVYAVSVFAMAAANLAVALLAGPQAWAAYNAVAPFAGFGALGLGMYLTFRRIVRARLRTAVAT
jgi:intracellular septation protein A